MPVEGGAYHLAVDPSTHTVYVANDTNTVSVIDGATRTVTATVPVGEGPVDLAVIPNTHTLYVTTGRNCANRGFCTGNGTVSVIDGATRTVTATVSVEGGVGDLAVDPDTRTLYVSTRAGVAVIDGSTRTGTVYIDNFPDNLAVDPTTHTVYVTTAEGVSVIDGATRAVTATLLLPGGEHPYGLAVDPTTRTVYVTYAYNDTMSVINGATRTVTAAVPLPGGEDGIHQLSVDPGTHTVYVGDGTVSVIEN